MEYDEVFPFGEKFASLDALVENGILVRRNKLKIRYTTAYLENVKAEMGAVVR